MILAVKKKTNMGYSRPQKTLQHFDNSTQPSKKPKITIETEIETEQTIKITKQQQQSDPLSLVIEQQEMIEESFSKIDQFSHNSELDNDDRDDDNDDEDDAIVIFDNSSPQAKQNFCYYCQKQCKNRQDLNAHNKTQKHNKNVFGRQTKFQVGEEIITNKDYDLLTSEKGWLHDSVRVFSIYT